MYVHYILWLQKTDVSTVYLNANPTQTCLSCVSMISPTNYCEFGFSAYVLLQRQLKMRVKAYYKYRCRYIVHDDMRTSASQFYTLIQRPTWWWWWWWILLNLLNKDKNSTDHTYMYNYSYYSSKSYTTMLFKNTRSIKDDWLLYGFFLINAKIAWYHIWKYINITCKNVCTYLFKSVIDKYKIQNYKMQKKILEIRIQVAKKFFYTCKTIFTDSCLV